MVPIPEGRANEAIAALDGAAKSAIEAAKASKKSVWLAQALRSQTIRHDGNGGSVPSGTYTMCQSSLLAWQSVNALQNVLEGLIRLAAWQHNQGIALLETGLEFRHAYLMHNRVGEDEAVAIIENLILDDLVALKEFRKVRPGLIERVMSGMIRGYESALSLTAIFDAFHSVQGEVEEALEDAMAFSRIATVSV